MEVWDGGGEVTRFKWSVRVDWFEFGVSAGLDSCSLQIMSHFFLLHSYIIHLPLLFWALE